MIVNYNSFLFIIIGRVFNYYCHRKIKMDLPPTTNLTQFIDNK